MEAPMIAFSSKEERLAYIRERFRCIGNCDMCGLCQVFHGSEPENVFGEYIEGIREFTEAAAEYR